MFYGKIKQHKNQNQKYTAAISETHNAETGPGEFHAHRTYRRQEKMRDTANEWVA